jgi:hypothetical protein
MDDSHALSGHRFLLRAGLALGNVFAWVLIFHALFGSGETEAGALMLTAFFYAFSQLGIFFLTPLSGANMPHGTVRSMLLATLALAAAFLWLGASSIGVFGDGPLNLWWGIVGFIALGALYRAFYWVPYKVTDLATGGWTPRTRFVLELFLALLPLCAALVITKSESGTWLILIGSGVLAFFASLPLIRLTDAYERFDWGYIETIQMLFSKPHRSVFSISLLDGIQGAGLLLAWPLTVFLLLDWSYFALGSIISITLLLALIARRGVRNYFREIGVHDSRHFSAALAASAWVLRIVVFSPVTVVIADTLYHIGTPVRRFGMDPVSYEQAADNSHYIDEYTALKEMGSALGRVLLCVVLVTLLFFASPLVALAGALAAAATAAVAAIYTRSGSHTAF